MPNGKRYTIGTEVKVRRSESPIIGIVQGSYRDKTTKRLLYSIKWIVLEDCPMLPKGSVFCNVRDETDLERCCKSNSNNSDPNICYKILGGRAYGSNKEA